MRQQMDCAINGISFRSLSSCLFLQQITEKVQVSEQAVNWPGYGQRLLAPPRHEKLTVTVSFMIKHRDPGLRQRIIDRINEWAAEGWLTVYRRPGQRIYVICTQPAVQNMPRWSDDLQIVLTAYNEAYWQAAIPVQSTIDGSTRTVTLYVNGNHPCCLEAEVQNMSGHTIDSLSLSANGRTLAFTGLGLADGDKLAVYYDTRHLLHADINGNGRLGCRSAGSDDAIILLPGSNSVSFQAGGNCSTVLSARGEWE